MAGASSSDSDGLLREIRRARTRLPREHRSLLEQIGAQEVVIDDWPRGVQDLYATLGEISPSDGALAYAAAVWLDGRRMVAFNGPLVLARTAGLTEDARTALVGYIAWHEYGHALSLTRAAREQREDGVRLLDLLPAGMRASIDYPGEYRRMEVFDEVIATVYTLLMSRIRDHGYRIPQFLDSEIVQAFQEVIPWPPSR